MGDQFVEADSKAEFAGGRVRPYDKRMICGCGSEWWTTKVCFDVDANVQAVLISGVECSECGTELPLGMEKAPR